jgi:PAS domain S-box-containing protein
MPLDFLSGGGEMGALIRSMDWSKTPIGAPETWSPALRTMLRILLANRFPLLLWWGPEYVQIYNDAYRPIPGTKHPKSLGQPASECWSEIWDVLGPLINTPFNGGPATWIEDFELSIKRAGFIEETHFTVAYSPVPDETAPRAIGGVLATVHEITEKIVGQRRVNILRDLGAAVEAKTAREACSEAAAVLKRHGKDIPFALIYLIEAEGRRATLTASSGAEEFPDFAPAEISLDQLLEPSGWPFLAALRTGRMQTVENLSTQFSRLPAGFWAEPPHTPVVLPIRSHLAHHFSGFLVAGLSSRLKLDEAYVNFLELVSSQIATAIATAQAYEEERKRAEALAEIDRAKTAFFSNVSHEFRTPLTLMLGPLENLLAENGAFAPEHRSEIETAHRNSLRLLKLVNSLLDFSRIEAGRIKASFAPADLSSLTADLASNFRSAMEAAGLELVVQCPPLPQSVYVDRDMWEKIVLNLLSNAFKFTFNGGVTVRVKSDGDRAVLTVSDTGTGIPEIELPRIFERFHRVEGAKGRTYEGSGIGLALIKELVKLHGGTVEVTSRIGEGSAFSVFIPYGQAHLPKERVVIGAAASAGNAAVLPAAFTNEALTWIARDRLLHAADEPPAEQHAGPRPRILLADDNADMREHVARILGEKYELVTVSDGQAALEEARRARPDLVLSDVMMPGLDGSALLSTLRADPQMVNVPFIMLSARAGEEARSEGMDAGADDYLIKPFSARELLTRIAAHLKLAKARQEAGERERVAHEVAEALNEISRVLASELDLQKLVQAVTDVATKATGAKFGAFFYNVLNQHGESYLLYTLSGAPREAFDKFGLPRNTPVFDPTFRGDAVVRSDDITKDPRYGTMPPHHGMPKGHLPVCSYLAAPVKSRAGEVFGGLFFGHPEPGIFTESSERLAIGIASHAAIAIENARLYQKADQQARASLLLASIVDSSDDAIISKDLDGVITSWNKSAERLFGYTAQEAIGKTVAELLIPSDRQEEEPKILARLRSGERVDHFETVRRHKDGGLLDISLTISPVRDPQGMIIGASKIARDITNQKRTERAIQSLNQQLKDDLAAMTRLQQLSTRLVETHDVMKLLQEIVSVAIETTGADKGNIQLLQDGVLRIIAQQGFDESFLDFFDEVHDGHAACGAALKKGGRIVIDNVPDSDVYDSVARKAMLDARAYAVQSTPLVTRSGEILGMFSTHYGRTGSIPERDLRWIDLLARQAADLIERRRAEQALRTSEERLRIAQSAAKVGVFDWNIQTGANTWSSELEELYGLPVGSFAGTQKAWEDLVHPEDREFARKKVGEAFNTAMPVEAEWRVIWPDGSVHWLAGRFQVYRDTDGTPTRMSGVNFEITARKKMENELRRANQDLEQFAYSASHDLQEPLRSVKIFSELLSRRYGNKLDDEALEFLGNVRDGARRMEMLVRDLLTYSQVATVEGDPEYVDSNAAMQAAIGNLAGAVAETGAVVDSELLPSVRVHRIQLQQLFQNLIGNAIKYHRPGFPPVVHTMARLENGHWVFSVTDNGIGIEPQFKERIFGLFKRLHGGDEYSAPGLGLPSANGLWNAIMGASGSNPSRGKDQPSVSPSQPNEVTGDLPDILVIEDSKTEDSKTDVYLIREALDSGEVKANVHVVRDGYAATNFFDAADADPHAPCPDLVLLDLNLPMKTGAEVLHHLRESRRCKTAQVLVISSSDSARDRASVEGLGPAGYFKKPTDYAEFLKLGPLVKSLLDQPTPSKH